MTVPVPRLPAPSQIVFRHVPLDGANRWRCAWRDHGFGTVVARVELSGFPTGYDVELDGDDGAPRRALPADLRLLRDIEIPPVRA